MNQEITLERCGEAIHLVYRHFRGSFYGNLLGNRLRLTGVQPPANGHGNGNGNGSGNGHAVQGLDPGQYYLLHPESDGEMHALLPASQLADIQQAVVHDLHIPVAAGAELFPPDVALAAGEEAERRSLGQILGAIVVGLLGLAVLGTAGFVVWRSVAHEDLAMTALIARMETPAPPPESGLGNAIQRWADARNVRIPLANVLFLSETKLVLSDGAFVAIEKAGDLRGLAALAEQEKSVPIIEARLGPTLSDVVAGSEPDVTLDRAVPLQRIRCGRTTFAETGTLKPIAVLTPSPRQPVRSPKAAGDKGFRIVTDLRFDERRTFAPLVQERISLRGRILVEESRRVLRLANGTGVALPPLPDGSHVEPFLAGLAGDKTDIEVDMVFERAYPWRNPKNSAESREATHIAGVGRVLSVSADGLFLTDER